MMLTPETGNWPMLFLHAFGPVCAAGCSSEPSRAPAGLEDELSNGGCQETAFPAVLGTYLQ